MALVHHPVVNRAGETTTTAITSTDIHDFARAAAFYDVVPAYIAQPAIRLNMKSRTREALIFSSSGLMQGGYAPPATSGVACRERVSPSRRRHEKNEDGPDRRGWRRNEYA